MENIIGPDINDIYEGGYEGSSTFNLNKPERCFCHLNGYKVKDAEARRKLDGTLPMDNIRVSSIECKNIFDGERWYKELKAHDSESIDKIELEGIEYYMFQPSGLSYYEFMKGEFKENTQYTISCKARKYDNVEQKSTGFYVVYTDGTNSSKFVDNTLEEYQLVLTTDENKTIDHIRVGFAYNNYVLMRDIQIEEGAAATYYTNYKKYLTSEDVNPEDFITDTGYHTISLNMGNPIQSMPFGEATIEITGNELNKFTDFINKVHKSNIKKPILKLINTANDGNESYYAPTEITYINSSTPIKDIQPNYMLFGVTLQTQTMLWRSRLYLTGTWVEDAGTGESTYTCNSATISLYDETSYGGSGSGSGSSFPIPVIEYNGSLQGTINLSAEEKTKLEGAINDYRAKWNPTGTNINWLGFTVMILSKNGSLGLIFTQEQTGSSDGDINLISHKVENSSSMVLTTTVLKIDTIWSNGSVTIDGITASSTTASVVTKSYVDTAINNLRTELSS